MSSLAMGGGTAGVGGSHVQSPLAAAGPFIERILGTQDRIASLQARLVASGAASQLREQTAAAALARRRAEAEAEAARLAAEAAADQDEDDEAVLAVSTPAASAASASVDPALLSPELHSLLQSQMESLGALQTRVNASPRSALVRTFDMLYLPIFTVLVAHPKAQQKQQRPDAAAAAPFPVLPHQDRVWELALGCLVPLLESGVDEPPAIRVALSKRFFGIFQLLLNFLPPDDRADAATPQQAATPLTPGVCHSEETRIAAMSCVHALFRCVEAQFASDASVADLQPLVTVFQLNPGFSISLGYYIHLMLRFVAKDRNRVIRAGAVGGLDRIMRVLQMRPINRAASASATPIGAPAFSPVPGQALLLSYFPGIVSALYNVLVYDTKSVRSGSGGWKLRLAAFNLFDALVCAVVRHVAGMPDIVDDVLGQGAQTKATEADEDDEPAGGEEGRGIVLAERTMEKLYALVPKPPTASRGASSALVAPSPRLVLSAVHPVLQSILKPIDAAWWRETRGNIADMMQRILASSQLTQRPEMAAAMLRATQNYIVGTREKEVLKASNNSATIYTTLLPASCVLTWLEFVIYCHEHDDSSLRAEAATVITQIGDKIGGWQSTTTRVTTTLIEGGSSTSSPASSSALVPLLSASFSRHLLRLPRLLATASESAQVALLKTIRGYVHILGRQQALYAFVATDIERLLKLLYTTWTVEGRESKVLERERVGRTIGGEVIPSTSSTALSLPTYYSFTFAHVHSAAAQDLSLSILHSMGFFLASHFGLFIAHLHERLLEGIRQIEAGNYSATNQVKETVLFINLFILGAGEALRENNQLSVYDLLPHIELLMFEYLNPILWHLPQVHDAAGTARGLSHADLQNNQLIVSFLVRGLGDMAVAVGVEFNQELMHLLYALFEKLASTHSTIHQAALVTLHRIAVACGYGEGDATATADEVLQRMIVENMDYLVEQMAVELRTLDLQSSHSSSTSTAHPLTLPLVLTSLLTKISLPCTQAIIPLLDDILKVILDKLCEITIRHEEEVAHEGEGLSAHMSRLAYLEILRSVVTAIHLIQVNDAAGGPDANVPSLYASTAPLPMPEMQLAIAAPTKSALDEADSMLCLDAYEDDQPKKSDGAEEEKKQEPESKAARYTPSAIRQRLQAVVATRAAAAENVRYESEWLRRSRSSGGVTIEEEKSEMDDGEGGDVPRDASGKTAAELWFEEREAERAKMEQQKYNTIHDVEDPEAEATMEAEAEAHKDAPEIPLTKEQQTALSVFQQCRHFLTPGSGPAALAQQYTTLCIAAEAIPVLERVPKQFFPEIAKFWPPLLQSLRLVDNAGSASTLASGSRVTRELRGGAFESSVVSDAPSRLDTLMSVRVDEEQGSASDRQLAQLIQSLSTTTAASGAPISPSGASFTHSTASPLFIQALSVLSLLSRTASKFLVGRFTNELWPVLQHILTFEKRWMAETAQRHRKATPTSRSPGGLDAATAASDAALQLLPAYKVQRALLQTLANLARFPDLASHHLLSLATHTAPYLSADQPAEFQQLAVATLQSLMQLDADVVWFVLWKLCPTISNEIPTPAESASSSAPKLPRTFLAHPCFQQAYPNFDAHFLCHQRTQAPTTQSTQQDSSNEYAANVRVLMRTLDGPDLPPAKLSLF